MGCADIHNGESETVPTGQTIDYNLIVSADTHSNTMKNNKQRSKAVSVSQKSAVQTAEKSNETAQQQAPRAAGSVQKLCFHRTPHRRSRSDTSRADREAMISI